MIRAKMIKDESGGPENRRWQHLENHPTVSHNGVTMRAKSVERLKEKIKKLTIRSHNFSHDAVQDLNRVIRGVANYYATDFSFPELPLSPYRASNIFLT